MSDFAHKIVTITALVHWPDYQGKSIPNVVRCFPGEYLTLYPIDNVTQRHSVAVIRNTSKEVIGIIEHDDGRDIREKLANHVAIMGVYVGQLTRSSAFDDGHITKVEVAVFEGPVGATDDDFSCHLRDINFNAGRNMPLPWSTGRAQKDEAIVEQFYRNHPAAVDSCPILYKYQSFDTQERKKWAREVLVEHRLYCPHRRQLDDPDDLTVKVVPSIQSETERSAVIHSGASAMQWLYPYMGRATARRRLGELISKPGYAEFSTNVLQDRLDAIRIYCMTSTDSNAHEWKEYADDHHGFCIGFDATTEPFNSARKVHYTDDPAVVHVPHRETEITTAQLTKSLKWKDEQEYRFVFDGQLFVPRGFEDGYLSVAQNTITEIIFGSAMPKSDIDLIMSWAAEGGLDVECRQSDLVPSN